MTLQQAIRIGLDNSEIVRVIAFGAQGIPIGGFEPTPLEYRGQRGRRQLTGCRHAAVGLRSGDPRDPDRHGPLDLRHRLHDQHPLGQQRTAVQQRRAGRLAQPDRDQVPHRLGERLGHVPDRACRSRPQTGATIGVVHNVNWSYQNSSFLVWPSAYTTNIQLTLTQPLLGSAPLAGPGGRPAGRPRGQPRTDRDRPAQRRRRRLAVQGRGHGARAGRSSSSTGTWPSRTSSSGAPIGPSVWPRRSSIASRPSCWSAAAPSPTSPRPPSGSNSSTSTW